MDQKVRAIEYTFVAALCQARGLVSPASDQLSRGSGQTARLGPGGCRRELRTTVFNFNKLAQACGRAECEIGRMKKLAVLINHYGLRKTIRGLLGARADGWKFERRINRGTWRNRAIQSGDLRQRRFDDPGIVMPGSRVVAD